MTMDRKRGGTVTKIKSFTMTKMQTMTMMMKKKGEFFYLI